jgi:hypothetical protein
MNGEQIELKSADAIWEFLGCHFQRTVILIFVMLPWFATKFHHFWRCYRIKLQRSVKNSTKRSRCNLKNSRLWHENHECARHVQTVLDNKKLIRVDQIEWEMCSDHLNTNQFGMSICMASPWPEEANDGTNYELRMSRKRFYLLNWHGCDCWVKDYYNSCG